MAQNSATQYQAAGLGRRLGAILYDFLIILSVGFLVTIVWTAFNVTLGHPLFKMYMLSMYLIIFFYYAWSWTHGGQTIGMKAWRIKLVRPLHHFGWLASMTRIVATLVSLAPLGAGFWWALLDQDGLTWHDRLSGSRLIKTDA